MRQWLDKTISKIEKHLFENKVKKEQIEASVTELRKNQKNIVRKAVNTVMPASSDTITDAVNEHVKKGKFESTLDDSESDDEFTPLNPKVSIKYKEIYSDVLIVIHMETFETLLTKWPLIHNEFTDFKNWRSKLKKYYDKYKIGQLLLMTYQREKAIAASELSTVKDVLVNLKSLLRPFPIVKKTLEKQLAQWSSLSSPMKKVLNMNHTQCTSHSIRSIIEARLVEGEKANGLNLQHLSRRAKMQVLNSIRNPRPPPHNPQTKPKFGNGHYSGGNGSYNNHQGGRPHHNDYRNKGQSYQNTRFNTQPYVPNTTPTTYRQAKQ